MIGNMHTCALIGMNGSVDYMCWYVATLKVPVVTTSSYMA